MSTAEQTARSRDQDRNRDRRGSAGDRGEDHGDQAPPKPPKLAYAGAAIGALLFALCVGLLGYEGLSPTEGKPAIELRVLDVTKTGSSWLARIEARNDGDATGAGVMVEGTLMSGGSELEKAQAEFDYVPSGSSRRGGLFFSRDPAGFELRLRVLGYVEP